MHWKEQRFACVSIGFDYYSYLIPSLQKTSLTKAEGIAMRLVDIIFIVWLVVITLYLLSSPFKLMVDALF